jgi:hypothetical protein
MTATNVGHAEVRVYHDEHVESKDDVFLSMRAFTTRVDAGLVAGMNLNVMFTIDRPASEIWPYARDWNLWQNRSGFYYSGVLGDLEGQTFGLSLKPDDVDNPHFYKVEKVIPDYLLVLSQPVLNDDEVQVYGLPGYGGYSAGNCVFMLNAFGARTTLTAAMEHASVMARPGEAMTEEQALAPLRTDDTLVPLFRWRDGFIPDLRQLVDDGRLS